MLFIRCNAFDGIEDRDPGQTLLSADGGGGDDWPSRAEAGPALKLCRLSCLPGIGLCRVRSHVSFDVLLPQAVVCGTQVGWVAYR